MEEHTERKIASIREQLGRAIRKLTKAKEFKGEIEDVIKILTEIDDTLKKL